MVEEENNQNQPHTLRCLQPLRKMKAQIVHTSKTEQHR